MKNIRFLIFCINFFCIERIFCDASAVYNFRIAETTKRNEDATKMPVYSISSLTWLNTYRNQYSGQRENYFAGLGGLVHVRLPFYVRVDWAAAKINVRNGDFHFSDIQTDDLLIMGGYSFDVSKQIKATFSGLLGIPTHKDLALVQPQYGIGELGLGTQLSGIFNFAKHPNHSLKIAGRIIHFFPRMQTVEGNRYKFGIGNIADLIIILRISSLPEKHRVSCGYNPTFFFGATITPNLDDIVAESTFIRHSFYMDYKYRFLIYNHKASSGWAIAYGFDTFAPCIRQAVYKRVINVWWYSGFTF